MDKALKFFPTRLSITAEGKKRPRQVDSGCSEQYGKQSVTQKFPGSGCGLPSVGLISGVLGHKKTENLQRSVRKPEKRVLEFAVLEIDPKTDSHIERHT